MSELITLLCPACGGKLSVGKNVSVIKCEHCGIEHIVRRSENSVTLESFARCPICGRNDRVEKVKAIYEYKTASSVLLSKLEPPSLDSIEIPIYQQIPEIELPKKRTLLSMPDSPELGSLMSLAFVFGGFLIMAWMFTLVYSMGESTSLITLKIIIAMLSLLEFIIIYLGNKQTRRINQRFKKDIEDRKRINKKRLFKWENSVENIKQEHSELAKSIQQVNKTLEKNYHLSKLKARKKIALWEKLYYCYRDDTVFIPDTGNFAQVEKMDEFLNNALMQRRKALIEDDNQSEET